MPPISRSPGRHACHQPLLPFSPLLPCPPQAASPEDKPGDRAVLELRAELVGKLGWAHWERQQRRSLLSTHPPAYPLF